MCFSSFNAFSCICRHSLKEQILNGMTLMVEPTAVGCARKNQIKDKFVCKRISKIINDCNGHKRALKISYFSN